MATGRASRSRTGSCIRGADGPGSGEAPLRSPRRRGRGPGRLPGAARHRSPPPREPRGGRRAPSRFPLARRENHGFSPGDPPGPGTRPSRPAGSAQVAGPIERCPWPRTERVGHESFGRQTWPLQIAPRHAVAADIQFARHTHGDGAEVPVEQVELRVGDRAGRSAAWWPRRGLPPTHASSKTSCSPSGRRRAGVAPARRSPARAAPPGGRPPRRRTIGAAPIETRRGSRGRPG